MRKGKNSKKDGQTLCWHCDHACKGGCSWADEFKPVNGWTAEHQVTNTLDSYYVKSCPLFVLAKRLKQMDDEGARALAEKVLSEAADDYIHCVDEIGEDVERFLRSQTAADVYGIEDPETIIMALKKKRYKFRQEREKRLARESRRAKV